MNCSLHCTLSYEQVINIKHWDTCEFSELLRLLPAGAHMLSDFLHVRVYLREIAINRTYIVSK